MLKESKSVRYYQLLLFNDALDAFYNVSYVCMWFNIEYIYLCLYKFSLPTDIYAYLYISIYIYMYTQRVKWKKKLQAKGK